MAIVPGMCAIPGIGCGLRLGAGSPRGGIAIGLPGTGARPSAAQPGAGGGRRDRRAGVAGA